MRMLSEKLRHACIVVILITGSTLLHSCDQKNEGGLNKGIHFTKLLPAETKISFNNIITENDSVNLIVNAYSYMGSGVGIGDFNNDGMQDIFFGASQQSSKLYINKGNFNFEDITKKAGVETSVWVTGVSVVDINNDGFDDIYLCVSGSKSSEKRKNLLYINNHDLTFTEQAKEYGLDDTLYSTQAVFFDYDKDGDLDMYLLNHLLDHIQSNNIVKRDLSGFAPARDKLYRNEGVRNGHPYYKDVSVEAGIIDDGYGLGVVVSDFNNDQWPDLYITNDYLANDRLWINNKNGTFTNTLSRSTKHQSYNSMGVDAGDINNDGLPDIISLDMQPEDNERKKMMFSFLNYDRYVLERTAGYDDEYIRNMLQLNNGTRLIRDTSVPFFSEVGQMAGISETDWSWSVLLADLDNDGLKDIHITNGYGRDVINNDFISFVFSSKTYKNRDEMYSDYVMQLAKYGVVRLNNYCYHNNGNIGFTDVTKSAGFTDTLISNGCAYVDLDNDGDLDLVVNNINKEASILRNDARQNITDTAHNYISVILKGDSLNKNGFGTKLMLYSKGKKQLDEQNPARGYLSTMDKRMHFGVGNSKFIDSLIIIWTNGKRQILKNFPVNQSITLDERTAMLPADTIAQSQSYIFSDVTKDNGIDFKHSETFFYDYGYQQLLPQKYSQLGPFIADGDINGDGLTDFFTGGAANQSGKFFIQQTDGRFTSKDLVVGQKLTEDLGCLLFDADGDKDLDLFINSGSNEYEPGSLNYAPRLYKNDGNGNFTLDPQAFPSTIFTSAQCVAAADYDGDGDLDLFIGGRISPNQYPISPQSYLLQNNGGHFNIVTSDICPDLETPGMITAAVWTDINGDKKPDLIITGEWMPVRFFLNENGKLNEITASSGLKNINGQWRSLAVADLDNDGDMDIVAGNLGSNNHYRVTHEQPMKLFAKDLDGNGSIDPVMAYYIKNSKGERELFPAANRDQFAAQVPSIKKKYLFHEEYSKINILNLFGEKEQDDMLKLICDETRSVWFENKGGGKFLMHALPVEAQIAPVNTILCTDVNKDGNMDIIIAGNEYQTEVSTGRYDASYGLFLKGDGKGNFTPMPPAASGLIIDGDVKDIKLITTGNNKRIILVAINDEKIKAFQIK